MNHESIYEQIKRKFVQLKAAKTMRSLYIGDSCTMSPSNLEAHGSPCRLILCDDGHEMSSFPRSGYPRAVKKDKKGCTLRTAIRNAQV